MIQENPQYFKPDGVQHTTDAWSNWDQAIIWLLCVAGVIVILVLYKVLRKFF